jgi:hypothetical protein
VSPKAATNPTLGPIRPRYSRGPASECPAEWLGFPSRQSCSRCSLTPGPKRGRRGAEEGPKRDSLSSHTLMGHPGVSHETNRGFKTLWGMQIRRIGDYTAEVQLIGNASSRDEPLRSVHGAAIWGKMATEEHTASHENAIPA